MHIEVSHYTKRIKRECVLDDVSCQFDSGSIYGIKGRNGSGKTMLMRAVLGLIRPTSGYVSIDGKVLSKDIDFPPSAGFLLESPAFIGRYSGLCNLELIAGIRNLIDSNDIRRQLVEVGLDPDDRRSYRKYSLGMKQRLGIACALMERPDLIVLDEPFNALDEEGIRMTRKLISAQRDRGALIVLACHEPGDMELLADEVIELDSGRIKKVHA